jgi:glycosyltransferase involved in cell wall biosynthesis
MMSFLRKLFDQKPTRKIFDPISGRKINVLIELDTFDKGGLQKVVLDSALRMDRDKFVVTIVSVRGEGSWADVAKKAGIVVFALDNIGGKSYRDILLERDIDLACSHFSRAGYSLFKELGIPNITFIHNVYAFMPVKVVRSFQKDDRYVDLYISVSNNATRYAVQRLGINEAKIITVPNGLIIEEHERRQEVTRELERSDFGVRPDDYLFLNVASYNLHKGHYLMADAMMKIKAIRDDIKILCVGNIIYPPHIEAFAAYLKANDLDKHILMPGYFTNIEAFHQMADAFLLPSFIEGWSIAMNEAMYYEKPMILTDTGGSSEVIENNDIGILIANEYGDSTNLHCQLLDHLAYDVRHYSITDELVEAMISFANNRDHWRQAGRKGRDKVLEKYNFDDVVNRYEEIFLKVLLSSRDA